MNWYANATDHRPYPGFALRPVYAAVLLSLASTAHGVTVVDSSTTSQTLSSDTDYLLAGGSKVAVTSGSAIVVQGIAPATFVNAGTVTGSTDNFAVGLRFNVSGSLVNQATGSILGRTSGVAMLGAQSNVLNAGEMIAQTGHAIVYEGLASGTIDNFGSINPAGATGLGETQDGIFMNSAGALTVNNHAGASIRAGLGDLSQGTGILIGTSHDAGSATIDNDGAISGFRSGIRSTTREPVTIVNSASGTIQATVNSGVELNQNASLLNYGSIGSQLSSAIYLAGFNNHVTLGTGSTLSGFAGNVMLSGGIGNTITLTGTGVENGNFIATEDRGYVQLTVEPGSNWILGGNVSMTNPSASTLTIGGQLTVSGTISNSAGGGTTIADGGRLTLGAGAASGMVSGDIVDNGTLALNRSDIAVLNSTVSGSGSLIQQGPGATVLNGVNSYGGGTNIAAGTLVASHGNALGSGAVANAGALQLDFASNGTLANALSGSGSLSKTGSGVASLTAAGSTQGNIAVNAGVLRLAQSGAFNTTGTFSTASNAALLLGSQATLNVGDRFTMNGTLVDLTGSVEPVISAATATIGAGATFNLGGYSAPDSASVAELASAIYTKIHTTSPGGLNGTFSAVRIGGVSAQTDYLTVTSFYTPQNFNVGVGLTWYAAHTSSPQAAHGTFTLSDAADSFDLDAVLIDEAANPLTGWDGKSLTKAGAGSLQLSKANRYTGATSIDAGTLIAGTRDIVATSSQVTVAAGARFDLNGFDQHVRNLAGAGNVTLGSAALNVENSVDTRFDGGISGSGSLTKTGANTLTLNADNSYTGTTTIEDGTLQLGAGGATGSVAGNITNNSALVFDRSAPLTYNGVIDGGGTLVQQGSGSVVLSDNQPYTGPTAVNAGALLLANGAQLSGTSRVTVQPGASFGGYGGVKGDVVNQGLLAVADAAPGFAGQPSGSFTIGGQLINGGELRMASPTPSSTLTVAGSYTGNNGRLTLSTALGDDQSATDRLVVHGDTAGKTAVKIQNAGGTGGRTSNGIQIVEVDGQSNGVFTLDSRVVAGVDEYKLYRGSMATPGDGDWYLRSLSPDQSPRPEPGAYLGNQMMAQSLFVQTLHDRAGVSGTAPSAGANGDAPTVWARAAGGHTDGAAAGGRLDQSVDSALVQAGIDVYRHKTGNQLWQVGVMAGYGTATTEASARDNPASARGSINGVGAGVYATWHGNASGADGPYVDAWLQYAHFDNTLKGQDLSAESYTSQVWSGSLEGGWAFTLAQTTKGAWLLEPQLQLIYSSYQADDHTESNGTLIHSEDDGGLATRLGVRLMRAPTPLSTPGWLPFVELNWWHGTSGNSIAFNQKVVSQDGPKDRAELKAGLQADVAKHWRIWGNVGLQYGNGGYRSIAGLLGARYSW